MRPPSLPLTSDHEAYDHACRLLLEPRSANPPDWRIDWDDAPWPVKVYTGGRRIPLPGPAAGRLDPGLGRLGWLLFHTFGISRVRHGRPRPVLRRPIPSGGSMYPTEAYLLRTAPPVGAYHYDPYRHELTDLGQPRPEAALRAALGLAGDHDLPEAVLVLANRFWKNFYKYGDFGYRLGAVDVGVALGRARRLAAAEFGVAEVRTDFADEVLNGCLGLDGVEESAYALVGLGPDLPCTADAGVPPVPPNPPRVLERSDRVKRSARFDAMHAAACRAGQAGPHAVARTVPERPGAPVVRLPAPEHPDLLDPDLMLRRTSNGPRFDGRQVSPTALATVLHHAARALAGLRRASGGVLGREVELYCAVQRVEAVPPGWYRYRDRTGDLVAVGARADGPDRGEPDHAEPGRELQAALFADTVNVELAGFSVHPAADRDFRLAGRGVRGYREQQLGVGVAVEAVTLAAAAAGLGSHPLLGFDVARLDRRYGLAGGSRSVLAQVCVGAVRPDPNWEVSVMPR